MVLMLRKHVVMETHCICRHRNSELVTGRCWVKAYVRRLEPNGTPIETVNEADKALEVYDPMVCITW